MCQCRLIKFTKLSLFINVVCDLVYLFSVLILYCYFADIFFIKYSAALLVDMIVMVF